MCCAHAHVDCCRLQVRRDGPDVDRMLFDPILHPVRLRHGARVSAVRRRDRRAQADARLTSFRSRHPTHVVPPSSSRRVHWAKRHSCDFIQTCDNLIFGWKYAFCYIKMFVNLQVLKIGYGQCPHYFYTDASQRAEIAIITYTCTCILLLRDTFVNSVKTT